MSSGDGRVEHVVTAWTVGQLRAALHELPIVVWVPEQPGDPLVQELVVIDASYSASNVGGDRDVDNRLRLGITVDWPTGSYLRARRRPPTPEP